MICRRIRCDVLRLARIAMPLLALFAAPPVRGQQFQYVDKIVVDEPTDLDWVYAHLGTSPAVVPADVAEDADRGGQFSYEFYGPVGDARSGAPLVIFVSPQDRPVGWDCWADVCESHGVMFAGIRDAGNGVPEARRIRAVCEVLSDVRRRHGGRHERTYLAGFSGGAHVAWRVACALPEQFGGVICIGHAPHPPRSAWQRLRLAERLSVAIINGDRDPATLWAERLSAPMLEEHGVRTRNEVLARLGHTMPPAAALEDAFEWLELAHNVRAGDFKRRLGIHTSDAAAREEAAANYLSSAKGRLIQPENAPAGLAALSGVAERWPDTAAAGEAQTLLLDYEQRPDKPWQADQRRQELKLLRIAADAYDRLARRPEPSLRAQRVALAANAKQSWEQLAQQGDLWQQTEAMQRLTELEKWLARIPAKEQKSTAVPMAKIRFELVGEVTLAEGIEHFAQVLAKLGYRLEVDSTAEPVIAASGPNKFKLEMPAATYADVDRRFFRRHGLKLVRKGKTIQLLPVDTTSSK